MCSWYHVIIFTASLRKYADPVIDMLATNGAIPKRLFREACSLQQGAFLKDLSTVSQDLRGVLIIDNSPGAFSLQTGTVHLLLSLCAVGLMESRCVAVCVAHDLQSYCTHRECNPD